MSSDQPTHFDPLTDEDLDPRVPAAATAEGEPEPMSNGLIFGRSPNLVIGAATALYGVAAVFHIFGFAPTAEQTGVVTLAIGALVALIANTNSIQQAAGEAAAKRSNGS